MSYRRIRIGAAAALFGSIGILGGGRAADAVVLPVEPAAAPVEAPPAVELPDAKPVELAPDVSNPRALADRGVPVFSGPRSRGGARPTPDASTWWRVILAGLYVAMVIGFRFFEAWRRER